MVIVTIAALVLLRFAWVPILMLFIFAGVTEPRDMAAVVIGGVVLVGAWLHAKLNGRRF
jgi:hypothetical protein